VATEKIWQKLEKIEKNLEMHPNHYNIYYNEKWSLVDDKFSYLGPTSAK